MTTHDAAWLTGAKQATFALDTDYYAFSSGLARRGADHDKAAIAAYIASGNKLLSWHAGADNLLSANDHVRNHTTMVGIAARLGLADPSPNARFFIVPGASHGQGQTLAEVDWATAIIDWVEQDTPPEQLTYAFTLNGTKRTMPVCQYPKYPKYTGTGDVNAASSYACQ